MARVLVEQAECVQGFLRVWCAGSATAAGVLLQRLRPSALLGAHAVCTRAALWTQVETKACLEAIDDVLSVPGITCAFLGA
jgi:2-keto-3-deoxy-L-rhamnonate aldolase RhmA